MADNSARVQFAGQDTIVQNNTKEQATEVTDGDVDSLYSEKGYGVEERDFKKKQVRQHYYHVEDATGLPQLQVKLIQL